MATLDPAVLPWFVPENEKPVPPVTFEDMIAKWGRGRDKLAIKSMEAKCAVFAEFLGHDNMVIVNFPDGRDWRDDMIADGRRAPGTIKNHIRLVKALFQYASDNAADDDPLAVNVLAKLKYTPGDGEERDDFTPDERRRILIAARDAEPHIKWLNWMCSFHGFRNGEVGDATTHDVELVDGIWVFGISRKNRTKDQGLKTTVSTRKITLHQAVIDEGFIDYVQSLPPGPLFPEVKVDSFGRRVGRITPELSLWLRNVVGIKDPRKPFYSHRHTATSFLRNTLGENGEPLVKESIERYILGHGKKGSHDGYGKRWFQTLKQAVEVIPNPLV